MDNDNGDIRPITLNTNQIDAIMHAIGLEREDVEAFIALARDCMRDPEAGGPLTQPVTPVKRSAAD